MAGGDVRNHKIRVRPSAWLEKVKLAKDSGLGIWPFPSSLTAEGFVFLKKYCLTLGKGVG